MPHTGRRTPSTEGLRLVAPALVLVTVVTGTALGAVLATSLGLMPLVGEPRLSLDAFTSLSNDLGAATGESLLTAATATLIAAAVGLAIASTCLHVRLARRAVIGLAVVVVTVPHLIGAAATALLLSDVGLAQRWTGVATSSWPELVGGRWPWATVLELAWKESAFVALVIVAAVGRRYRELAEIASVLGATPRQRWRRVLVPLAGPALVGPPHPTRRTSRTVPTPGAVGTCRTRWWRLPTASMVSAGSTARVWRGRRPTPHLHVAGHRHSSVGVQSSDHREYGDSRNHTESCHHDRSRSGLWSRGDVHVGEQAVSQHRQRFRVGPTQQPCDLIGSE